MPLQPAQIIFFLALVVAIIVSPVYSTGAETTGVSLTIDKAAHFISADGSDVVIQPGTYQVEAADPWLRLIPGKRRDALLLDASGIRHDEHISKPVIRLITDGTESVVQVLLPDGQGLETVGTKSGVRSRAVKRSRAAKTKTNPKIVSRRPMKKNLKTHSSGKTVHQLEKQVSDLQKILHALQNRLSKLESAVQVSNTGMTLNSSGKIKLNATTVEISSGTVNVNAGMTTFTGVAKSDTVVTNSVVSSSYTPGAGNIW